MSRGTIIVVVPRDRSKTLPKPRPPAPRQTLDWADPQLLKQIEDLSALGLTQGQIAERLGVSRQLISEKKKQIPDLSDIIKKGRARGVEQATSKLQELIAEKDLGAIAFYLKARGGWSDRVSEKELKAAKQKAFILFKLCEEILNDPAEEMAAAKKMVSLHLDRIMLEVGEEQED